MLAEFPIFPVRDKMLLRTSEREPHFFLFVTFQLSKDGSEAGEIQEPSVLKLLVQKSFS